MYGDYHQGLSDSLARAMYCGPLDSPAPNRLLYSGPLDLPPLPDRGLYSAQLGLPPSGDRDVFDEPPGRELGFSEGDALESGQDVFGRQCDAGQDLYCDQGEDRKVFGVHSDRDVFSGDGGGGDEGSLYKGQAEDTPSSGNGGQFVAQTEGLTSGDVTPPTSPLSLPFSQVRCMRCKEKIRDRHLMLLNDGRFLHEHCLWCEECRHPIPLTDNTGKMFLRDNKLYCFNDYRQLYGSETKRKRPCCNKCSGQLEKGIWVRRADNYLFHVTCFCCSKCDRQLSGSDRFVMREGRVICDKHFHEHDGSEKDESPKPRAKRMRTSFTEEQVRILQQHFAIDSNPDGQDLERIAKATGLKKRVTQVWFQNNRARHKKSMMHKPSGGGGGGQALPSFSPPMSALYGSTSEEGESTQGTDMALFATTDLDHHDDSGGGGGGGGVGGGPLDFTQQPFWPHPDN